MKLLDVTELAESAVYEIADSEYVRKAEVNEERKDTRLQGLKDHLALSDDPDAEALREEVADLEQRIAELTEFTPGTEVGTRSQFHAHSAKRHWVFACSPAQRLSIRGRVHEQRCVVAWFCIRPMEFGPIVDAELTGSGSIDP